MNIILFAFICTIIGDTYSYGTVYFESWYNFPYIAYIICFLPYCITYLILKHRLFDARSMLLHMLRWLFIGFTGALTGLGLYWMLLKYGYISHFEIALLLVDLIPMIVVLLLARSHRIRSIFRLSDVVRLENDAFEFTASSAVYKSNEELIEDILSTLQGGLKINSVQLIGRNELNHYPQIKKALPYEPKIVKILSYKEAKIDEENGKKVPYMGELEKLGEMCVPIFIEKELAYIFVLPEKSSEAPYTQQEKKIIITLRPKIALSLQILEYNKSLRDEVERQTTQINEQKKELEVSYKKLETLDHEKDVFMNMAAHELRTPLTIMRGYADMMYTGVSGELNEIQKKLAHNILRGGESLLELVNDLLDLSRIDAGKMQLNYTSCDIKEITNDIHENFTALMAKKDMKFQLEETLDTSHEFFTDKAKLTLIYNNLLSNAYKYTPEHGNVVWKTGTELVEGAPWLVFSVTDSGVGIPTDELPRIFDRFASISTHNDVAATIQSTGLGLSIVKKIIVGMGGTIDVTSVVKQGSTFTVRLPYAKPKGGIAKL